MAFRDFLHTPQEAPTGCCEVQLSRGANASHTGTTKEVLPPYMRSDAVRDSLTGAVEPGSAGEADLILALPPAVERPDFGRLPSTGTRGASPTSRRRLLWEILDGYHCSICGTCLSFADLGRIAAKAGIQLESDETEHGIHGHFREPMTPIGRRRFLAALATAGAAPMLGARAFTARRYIGCRINHERRCLASVFDESGAILHDVSLPGRGHGFAVHPPTGHVVVFARRPGEWALVVDTATGAVVGQLSATAGRHF